MRIKIDKLDTLFSKYIRLRAGGKCDMMGNLRLNLRRGIIIKEV